MKKPIAFVLSLFIILSLFVVSGGAIVILEDTVYSAGYVCKVSPALKAAFDSNDDEAVKVVIWSEDVTIESVEAEVERLKSTTMQCEGVTEREDDMSAIQSEIRLERSIAAREYYRNNLDFAVNTLDIDEESIEFISKYSPLIICRLDQDSVINVANNKKVESITLDIDDFLTEETLESNSVSPRSTVDPTTIGEVKELIGADLVQAAGYDGSGIILGMFENNKPDVNNAAFNGVRLKIICQEGLEVGEHATQVASIMVGNGNEAIAPGFSKLYCAGGSYRSGIEWLLDNGVNVINISCSPYYWINGIQVYSEYADHSKWLDHIAYNHSVHVVAGAGNEGANGVSLYAMAFNVIAVGNVVDSVGDNNVDDLFIESSSSYNATSSLVFKPDLCAPGTHLYIPNVATAFPGVSGTSLSAPVVSASIALLLDYAPTLLKQQSVVKAILLAGVSQNTNHRYSLNTIDYSGYRRYGSGIINVANALTIMSHGNYVKSSVQSTQTNRTYSIGSVVAGKPVSVVLVFLKRCRYTSSSADHGDLDALTSSTIANLDLSVYSSKDTSYSSAYGSSNTTFSNVEKIIFTPTSSVALKARIDKISTYQNPYEIILAVAWYQDDTVPLWQ